MAGKKIGACVLALALAGAGSVATAQQTEQTNAPQPQVPNAPVPQTLPRLNTITPPAPLNTAPLAAPAPGKPDAATVDNGGAAPGTSLPSAPGTSLPSAPSPTATSQTNQEPAPELPAAGQGANAVYTLGTVHVDFVQVPFTVKDSKGQLVPGLTWRDVRVYENG
ncbi:MAG TPA: hypothetical protein VLI45_09860, partial [Acidobacteriaceae bacterium]|nr:hypothetical protein [Acidobacteriaceae bacterium]